MSNITPVDQLRNTLTALEPQFQKALPKHVTVERFTRVLMTAVQQQPNLVSADRTSLLGACMKAAAEGLLPDGNEAAIVTFKNKDSGLYICQYMPMIGGILKKVRNSGELKTITSEVVFEYDKFEYYIDSSGPHFEHRPNIMSDRGKRIGVYAVAVTKDGGTYFEFMNEAEVMDVAKVSRSRDKGPWSGSFSGEMWKKTVIRRLAKRLPKSTDLDMTLSADDEFFEGEPPAREELRSPEQVKTATPAKKSRLEGAIEAQSTRVTESEEVNDPPAGIDPQFAEDQVPI